MRSRPNTLEVLKGLYLSQPLKSRLLLLTSPLLPPQAWKAASGVPGGMVLLQKLSQGLCSLLAAALDTFNVVRYHTN